MRAPPPTTVGIAHTQDEDVGDDEVLALAREAVDAVGGIGRFVRPGDLVVLKPNQTLWFLATDGVTTDPRLVAAMVRLCREAGAAHIVVGDSSGGDLKTKRVMDVTGVTRYAEAAGADEVVAFEDVPQETIEVDVDGERHHIKVPKVMLEAQCIINLPKAKTHFEDLISCCLKNWVGIVNQEERPAIMIEGFLQKATAAVFQRVPAHLNVVDGLWAGEATGPASNDAVWLGCVVAGTDAVAVDSTVARLMGFTPAGLTFAAAGAHIGLGTRDPENITIVGPSVDSVAIRAKPSKLGFDHLPVRVLVGDGVTMAGSLGHFKSIAETFLKFGMWPVIDRVYGPPTFMIGRVNDPEFDSHVEKGPYFVIDDAAHERYKRDPRVTFIPGHPATHNIFPHIFKRLHVEDVGPKMLKLESVIKQTESYFHFRSWSADAAERPRQE